MVTHIKQQTYVLTVISERPVNFIEIAIDIFRLKLVVNIFVFLAFSKLKDYGFINDIIMWKDYSL